MFAETRTSASPDLGETSVRTAPFVVPMALVDRVHGPLSELRDERMTYAGPASPASIARASARAADCGRIYSWTFRNPSPGSRAVPPANRPYATTQPCTGRLIGDPLQKRFVPNLESLIKRSPPLRAFSTTAVVAAVSDLDPRADRLRNDEPTSFSRARASSEEQRTASAEEDDTQSAGMLSCMRANAQYERLLHRAPPHHPRLGPGRVTRSLWNARAAGVRTERERPSRSTRPSPPTRCHRAIPNVLSALDLLRAHRSRSVRGFDER